MDAADRVPAASVDTARYSTSVPAASGATSWKTRGVVSSAVPSGVHSSSPTTRHAKLVSAHASAMSALTGASPVSAAPASGTATVSAVASAGAVTWPSAVNTTDDRAGTVTDATPVASVVNAWPPPYSGVNAASVVSVGTETVLSVVALLVATRYSIFSVRSTRLNAYTPAPSSA